MFKIRSIANFKDAICCIHPLKLRMPTRSSQQFHTCPQLMMFHEDDKKAGYRNADRKKNKKSYPTMVKEGLKLIPEQLYLFKDEVIEKFRDDPDIIYSPGDHTFVWKFDNEKALSNFVVTCDRHNREGYSDASFTLTENKTAMFKGNLSLRLPKDGIIQKSGYCNIRCMRAMKSFYRDDYYNWTEYTHLMLRVRGDGRPYLLNISTQGYFDLLWNDVYHYVLHTRGGPYWQLTLIPFSKFFLAHKGRIQDKQGCLPQNHISHFGITCCDRNNGPFQLEIDYIGLYYDPSHTEEFAYEMYKFPFGVVD